MLLTASIVKFLQRIAAHLQRHSFTTNLLDRDGFEVKVLLTSIPDDACLRNRGTSGFDASRRGCWRSPSRRYRSTSNRIVIVVTSLSRVARDDGRTCKETPR